jgi:type I restriction enzyme M protein
VYNPANRHERKATWGEGLDSGSSAGMTPDGDMAPPDGRWRCHSYDECMARDKASLDIFWLKDDSLADSDNLPPPEVIAQEIVEDLEAALEQFRLIAGDLSESPPEAST